MKSEREFPSKKKISYEDAELGCFAAVVAGSILSTLALYGTVSAWSEMNKVDNQVNGTNIVDCEKGPYISNTDLILENEELAYIGGVVYPTIHGHREGAWLRVKEQGELVVTEDESVVLSKTPDKIIFDSNNIQYRISVSDEPTLNTVVHVKAACVK